MKRRKRPLLAGMILLVVGLGSVQASRAQTALRSLKGDASCRWGSSDCNRCVRNVSAELDRLQSDYSAAGRIRFDGYAYPTSGYILHRINSRLGYEHVQSVGRLAGVPRLVPDPAEVASTMVPPLHYFLNEDRWRTENWSGHELWFIEVEGEVLWGASAAIMRSLLGVVRGR